VQHGQHGLEDRAAPRTAGRVTASDSRRRASMSCCRPAPFANLVTTSGRTASCRCCVAASAGVPETLLWSAVAGRPRAARVRAAGSPDRRAGRHPGPSA
jgi:hypothetical protein